MRRMTLISQESNGRKFFNILNMGILFFVSLVALYPMLYVLFASLSDPDELMSFRGFLFKPLGFFAKGYVYVFNNRMITRGYLNTIFIIVAGVSLNIVLTSLGAYFMSRKGVMLRNAITMFILVTMYFNGGLIPFYLVVRNLGLRDSLFSLILPAAINTFNLIILRTAFAGIPDSMEESARIDGARHFTILFRIMLPLAKATIAVLVLYYGVYHWNSWFNAMLFINNKKLYPLQLALREIILQNQTNDLSVGVDYSDQKSVGEVIKYAAIVVSTVPILALYPFLQKYFVKGIIIGAVKG
jgi:putative aldouronate transport system permease protein